jgi:hypothetical protein
MLRLHECLQRNGPCSLAYFSTSHTALAAAGTADSTPAGAAAAAAAAEEAGRRRPKKRAGSPITQQCEFSTLDACLQTLHKTSLQLGLSPGSSSSSSDALTQQKQAVAALQTAVKQKGDHWLLLRCGEWQQDVKENLSRGLLGPALALLQVSCSCYTWHDL